MSALYMEDSPSLGTLQGDIKTQAGMANVLAAGANRREMLVFNLQLSRANLNQLRKQNRKRENGFKSLEFIEQALGKEFNPAATHRAGAAILLLDLLENCPSQT